MDAFERPTPPILRDRTHALAHRNPYPNPKKKTYIEGDALPKPQTLNHEPEPSHAQRSLYPIFNLLWVVVREHRKLLHTLLAPLLPHHPLILLGCVL